jgi:hypothetical protein
LIIPIYGQHSEDRDGGSVPENSKTFTHYGGCTPREYFVEKSRLSEKSMEERIGKLEREKECEAPESFKLHGCDDVALGVTTDVGNYCNSSKFLVL